MRHKTLLLVVTICVATILGPEGALAKGVPKKIVISGPGIAHPLVVTDRAVLRHLGLGELMNVTRPAPTKPTQEARSDVRYRLIAYVDFGRGKPQPFDELHYYPPAGQRRVGLVFYDGLLGGMSGDIDGSWHFATPAGDRALRPLLPRLSAEPRKAGARTGWTGPLLAVGLLLAASVVGIMRLRKGRSTPDAVEP